MPAKAGTQGGPALRLRPWAPASAGAAEKRSWEPSVWFIPLVRFHRPRGPAKPRLGASAFHSSLACSSRMRLRSGRILNPTCAAFYDTLVNTMKNGRSLGQSGRYARLTPVVDRIFDVPSMIRLTIGSSWATLPPAQQQQLTEAFRHYIAATYAYR